jgi:hypothetical protein
MVCFSGFAAAKAMAEVSASRNSKAGFFIGSVPVVST